MLCCHTVRTRNVVTGVTKCDRQFRGQVYCKLNVFVLNYVTFFRTNTCHAVTPITQ